MRRYEINKITGTFNLVVYEIVGYKEEELVSRRVFYGNRQNENIPNGYC